MGLERGIMAEIDSNDFSIREPDSTSLEGVKKWSREELSTRSTLMKIDWNIE
jgi:hypothetical protein